MNDSSKRFLCLLLILTLLVSSSAYADDDNPYDLPCGVSFLDDCGGSGNDIDSVFFSLFIISSVGYLFLSQTQETDHELAARRYSELQQGRGIRLTSYESAFDIRLLDQSNQIRQLSLNNNEPLLSEKFGQKKMYQLNLLSINSYWN